jgi:RPC5 protein
VVASYTVYIAPPPQSTSVTQSSSTSELLLLQYPAHRPSSKPYNTRNLQKPTSLRIKPTTGLLEVDVPIDTRENYSHEKGSEYGKALKRSRVGQQGGTHGLAGGFNTGVVGRRFQYDGVHLRDIPTHPGSDSNISSDPEDIITTQTLGGKIVKATSGDPIYMLGSFSGSELHLSHLDALVQIRPQLHHLDAADELERSRAVANAVNAKKVNISDAEPLGRMNGADTAIQRPITPTVIESKAVDIKFKGPDDSNDASLKDNAKALREIQTEPWQRYSWIDQNDQRSSEIFSSQLRLQIPTDAEYPSDAEPVARLESVINNQDWLDRMSAPRQVGQGKKSLMAKVKGREREKARRRKNDEAKRQKEIVERGGLVAEVDVEADRTAGETGLDSTDESELSDIDPEPTPPPEDFVMVDVEEVKEQLPVAEQPVAKKPKGRPRKSQPAETINIDD